jgi:hypothetical protein
MLSHKIMRVFVFIDCFISKFDFESNVFDFNDCFVSKLDFFYPYY